MYKVFCFQMLMTALVIILIVFSAFNKLFVYLVFFVLFISISSGFLLTHSIRASHVLLCLLSFQRFMVLFFPSTEKYVTFNKDEVKRFIWSTYALGLIPIAMNYLQVPNVDVVSGLVSKTFHNSKNSDSFLRF